jgi:cyclopropane-fatty-acyl-phospholipid synthase
MFIPLPENLRDLKIPLRLQLAGGMHFDLGPNPQVSLIIHDPTLLAELSRPSLDLLGSAYVEGRFDIQGPITEVIALSDRLSRALLGDALSTSSYSRHDRASDAEDIHYHYDLSNDFYGLWLDPEMVYSCAYFETAQASLEQAQLAKLRHLCRKLRLQPGERLLDVGCGWGALARLAAREFDVEVVGITLSEEQLRFARQRVEQEQLTQRVSLQLQDYRDLPEDGQFDKVVSVGMLEHVGHANLPLYCRKLFDALRPGGLVMNHGITSSYTDGRSVGRGAGDFIERYVFPHGELPHLATLVRDLGDAGLEVMDVENLRQHYARTLEHWSARLEGQLQRAAQRVPERVVRIWRLYLAGSAYGFAHGWMSLHQVLALKPMADGGYDLPWTRADLYG